MLIFKKPAPARPRTGAALSPIDQLHESIYRYLKKFVPTEASTIWMAGQKIHDLNERSLFYHHVVENVERELNGRPPNFSDYIIYKYTPVSIREFICSPYYLNKANEIYPEVLNAAAEMNNGTYTEAVLTGGIGSGKTTLALYSNAYQLYLLSCMRSPHKLFGLDPSSEILLIFQSITKMLAMGVDYRRFRSMLEGSTYFVKHFNFDRHLESKMVFPNRIEVQPVAGTETAAIGQNVIGGLIDELNYMAVVEKSKNAIDKGTYDQAVALYNSIARRRKSRFMENGKLPGILCLVSSKKYPGQFTDQKIEEATRDKTIFVYDKRVWDIKPGDFGRSGWFSVFVGDMTRKPRILHEDDQGALTPTDRQRLVLNVPNEFREEFQKDIINALREIGGVSTLARHPFFMEVDKVSAAFKPQRHSIFSQSPVDFVHTRLTLIKGAFYKPHLPRFAHIDLAISGDSAGLGIGCVESFVPISTDADNLAMMPKIWVDGVLEIRPPPGSEILFSKIREVLKVLRRMGLNIRWVTYDQFQSTDSQQILRQWGLITGLQSMDTVPCLPYAFAKSAMYEGRLSLPPHPHLQKELLMLERDVKTGKIDHPPDGSKDCADTLAGIVFGLTMRREIWLAHGVPMALVPNSILSAADKLKAPETTPDYQEFEHPVDYTRARIRNELT